MKKMNIQITHSGKTETYTLEALINHSRQVIWIGGHSDGVYNTINIDGIDTFQCSISYIKETDTWEITNGQVRTECPKGLKSNRAKACSLCTGRCVNPRTANPTYSYRKPKGNTLINGEMMSDETIRLKENDCISFRVIPKQN